MKPTRTTTDADQSAQPCIVVDPTGSPHEMKNALRCLILAVAAAFAVSAPAADPATRQPEEPTHLDAVLVEGFPPSPGFWTAKRGEKTILILSTLSPVPRDMQWRTKRFEQTITSAQEVLAPPGVSVGTSLGFVRGALLWPAYRRSRFNPENKSLGDVLPPDVMRDWVLARTRYQLPDRVDRLRPVHAAQRLFDVAMHKRGLVATDLVTPFVRKTAKRHSIPVRETKLRIQIPDPKPVLQELSRTALLDVPCLQRTLERLEQDTETLALRANAWAEGDSERVRALAIVDQREACRDAFANTTLAHALGVKNVEQSVLQAWLSAADASLGQHDRILAVVPFDLLDGDLGLLSALTARGFEVMDP